MSKKGSGHTSRPFVQFATRVFCSFLTPHQHPRDPRPMHLHGTRGAELLTAEAADALITVNDRFFVFHGDGLGRTDICALGTAHALT